MADSDNTTALPIRRGVNARNVPNCHLAMTRAWKMVRSAVSADINAEPGEQECRQIIDQPRTDKRDQQPAGFLLSAGLRAAAAPHRARLGSYARHAW